ncbi:hypothetical protein LQW54_000087 [Pestalotiopsis sp. IQ-011]
MEDDMVTEHSFINGMIKATHPAISGGLGLDELNAATFRVFDDLLRQIPSTKTVLVRMDRPDDVVEVEFVPRPEAKGKTWGISFSGEREEDLSADS